MNTEVKSARLKKLEDGIKRSVEFLRKYGTVVFLGSAAFVILNLTRILYISLKPEFHYGSYKDLQELKENYDDVYQDNMDREQGLNYFRKLSMSTDEDRAVILGYRHALMFVVVVDFVVSIVFLVQGWMMI